MGSLIERVELLQKAEGDPQMQAALFEICRRDILFWINNFCYTYDPRTEEGVLPFNLYPYQEWFVLEVVNRIIRQIDVDVEKSRDLGMSWMIGLIFQWFWIFDIKPVAFLIGSITETDIDKNLVDPSDTIFGKLRFNLMYQPKWIIHRGEYTDRFLSMVNNKTGSVIEGRAPVATFGRGARKTAIWFDELSYWPWGRSAFEGSARTTNCRLATGTPNGKHNIYGERMTHPEAKRLVFPGRALIQQEKGIYE